MTTSPPAPPAGIYCRISDDKAGEGLGVQRQEADCRDLAARHGYQVAKVYVDDSISAYSGKHRPAYRAMLDDLAAGRLAVVIAWHPDRLHRSPLELEEYIALVERTGTRTETVNAGTVDLSNSTGRAVARTIGAWARQESEHKAERVQRAREQAALAGKYTGGPRRYGYTADGLEVVPAEAEVIREATEKVIGGVTLRAVVSDLNRRGVPTRGGKVGGWRSQTLRSLVMRARNAGLSVHRGEVVGPGQWPAIVSEDQWRAVVAILSDPDRRTSPAGRDVRWLGSGLYTCEVCGGSNMRVVGGGKGPAAYRCLNRAPTDTAKHVSRNAVLVDQLVEAVIVARLADPAVLRGLTTPTDVPDAEALVRERDALRVRLDDLAAAFADGEITRAQLAAGTERMRGRVEQITARLTAASSAPAASVLEGARGEDEIRARWARLDLGTRRAILSSLVTVVILPVKKGRAPDGTYFDPRAIRFDWKGGA
ncbi:recombinase family protein [Rhodococcus sp. IEGM 1408]|uniref:recombinase family protein n=1 Tax=Rhodococcus sp. IEGM 1408 TaxID=3082220 RepID=UPI002954B264|nr:recombinase family protein [Rhodococcus sp. IEGM 1408]MDV8000384.1 recombinase family protein [Rhodococcus sp. IEGM 1408]